MTHQIRLQRSLMFAAAAAVCGGVTIGEVAASRAADKSSATAVLWRDPGAIGEKDLYWGLGSAESAPQPPFKFVKEDTGGTQPKMDVTDARGTKWSVKFAHASEGKNEVHAEIAASRLMSAFGYMVEENYYVREGTIEGVAKLGRAAFAIGPDGAFRSARFEKRPTHIERTGKSWSFDDNPFKNSKEMSGLKILTTLLNNWDIRSANTNIFRVSTPNGVEDWYLFSDLGATFGRTDDFILGVFSNHNRWSLSDYQKQPLVDGVKDGQLRLHYNGHPGIDTVPIQHARWFAGLADQIQADQVRRAFEAAGASEPEIAGFTARVMEKIRELRKAVDES